MWDLAEWFRWFFGYVEIEEGSRGVGEGGRFGYYLTNGDVWELLIYTRLDVQ